MTANNKTNICLLLLLFPMVLFAQTHRVDSLKRILRQNLTDSHRLDVLLSLCREQNSLNRDTVYAYATVAKKIALARHDKINTGLADCFLTESLSNKGFKDSVLGKADKGLKKFRYIPREKEVYMGFIITKVQELNNLGRPRESLNLLFPLLSEAEKKGDTLSQVKLLNSISSCYSFMNLEKDAMQWCYKALYAYPGNLSRPYTQQYSITLGNIGLNFIHRYELGHDRKNLDSADRYITKAIILTRKNELLGRLAYMLGLKGSILGYYNRAKEAEAMLLESLQIYAQVGDTLFMVNTMSILGNFYHLTGQPAKGIAICKKGIALTKGQEVNIYLYQNLADNYKLAHDYLHYGETQEQITAIKDSIYKNNSAVEVSRLQAKYEVQKKENTIIQQKLDINKKNSLLYGTTLAIIALLMIGYVTLQVRKKNEKLRIQQLDLEQRNKTARAVMEGEEGERKRIAADLHDGVAQKMVVAKLNIEALENYLPAFNPEQRHIYDNILSLVDESCSEVRSLSHTLMPQAFFKSGLTNALQSFIDKIDQSKIRISFSAEGNLEHIGQNMEISIYRIIQESIQNVIKHAKATRLDISLIAENGELDVTIEDNGVGFDAGNIEKFEGMGMKNMRSRVEFFNGTLDIGSRPGEGAIIAFYIPFKNA